MLAIVKLRSLVNGRWENTTRLAKHSLVPVGGGARSTLGIRDRASEDTC